MKTRRLSEIDLARFASLPAGPQLEQALRAYNAGGGAWSYEPVRESTGDILAAKTPLLGDLPPISWDVISGQIVRACKRGVTQASANLEVGKVLYDATRRLGWVAAKLSMSRLPIGFDDSVRFWSDVVLEDSDGIFIPFFDHRRGRGLSNPSVMQIVFSMQHLWVRERNPDLMHARLAVIRFPIVLNERSIRLDFHSESELLPYDDLDSRVRVVYETWARISDERVEETRRTGTGGPTPFGF